MAPAMERPQVRVVFAKQGRLIRVRTTWRLAEALGLEPVSCRVNVPYVFRSNSSPVKASPCTRPARSPGVAPGTVGSCGRELKILPNGSATTGGGRPKPGSVGFTIDRKS